MGTAFTISPFHAHHPLCSARFDRSRIRAKVVDTENCTSNKFTCLIKTDGIFSKSVFALYCIIVFFLDCYISNTKLLSTLDTTDLQDQ